MKPDQGPAGIDGYRAFLETRDGTADPISFRLEKREAFYRELAEHPVRSMRPLDRDVYLRNLTRRSPEKNLDPRTLWVLTTAKANTAERYGVGLGELQGQGTGEAADPIHVHISLQEHYHTRTLAHVVEMFGVPFRTLRPPLALRLFIHLLVKLDGPKALPLVGASEMAGCVIFRAMRDLGVELFADEPDVAARVKRLYDEILADEVGHVGFIAASLGPGGRRMMRVVYRVVLRRMLAGFPELCRLLGRDRLRELVREPFRLEPFVADSSPDRICAAAWI